MNPGTAYILLSQNGRGQEYIYINMNLATQRITLITEAISKTGGRRRVANGRHPWRKSNEWQDQSQAAELLDQMEEEGGGGGG